MRLFIAVELDEEIRKGVCALRDALGAAALSGRLTRRENLHLTLAFLGEYPPSRVMEVKRCMERASTEAFYIGLRGAGRFKRRGGDIWWMGVEDPCSGLTVLAGRLADELRESGFSLEDREFKPHLTLAREVRMPPGFDPRSLPGAGYTQRVSHMTLFSSERDRGVLVYRPLVIVPLR